MLSLESQQKIEKLLLKDSLVPKEALEEARQKSSKQGKPLLQLLVEENKLSEENLTRVEAMASGTPYVKLDNVKVNPDILGHIPKSIAESYRAVPFGMVHGRLAVAMLDPSNVQAADFISRKAGMAISTYMASAAGINEVLGQYSSDLAKDVSAALEKVKVDIGQTKETQEPGGASNLQTLVQDAPITRALNAILDYAVQSRASDIHIEPREKNVKVRYRVDGILQDSMTLPKTIEPALISRIKILSDLKIDEHRIPQDGQFQINSNGREVDLRVAIAPITWGEQVVIRLLEKDSTMLTLEALGFRGRAFRSIQQGIKKTHGMILSTGPTGSGKTTTLYAVIQAIEDVSINIVTLEDPVEYKIDGINQIQVNSDVGLTFATGLRSILRQDPNVVMVGEIRDKETAELAVQAALTGHVVLSSLHTNSASGVLPRLLDMDIEPFLLASTINTVIGQRLVRKLCEKCRLQQDSSETETASVQATIGSVLPKNKEGLKAASQDLGFEDLPLADQKAYTLYKANAKGCTNCNNGYKGRIGIYEVFSMNDDMEKILATDATTSDVQKLAQKSGMLTMKQDGYLKALAGLTTLEEVARVASDY